MANGISGCRIKKYNAPLTTEELERLYKARWRQDKQNLVMKMAQEEAWEQERKCKQQGMVVLIAMGLSKRHKFCIITDDMEKDEEKTPPPFIVVQLGKECRQTYAFIDSGADGNTISYELFKKLEDVKLIEIDAMF